MEVSVLEGSLLVLRISAVAYHHFVYTEVCIESTYNTCQQCHVVRSTECKHNGGNKAACETTNNCSFAANIVSNLAPKQATK